MFTPKGQFNEKHETSLIGGLHRIEQNSIFIGIPNFGNKELKTFKNTNMGMIEDADTIVNALEILKDTRETEILFDLTESNGLAIQQKRVFFNTLTQFKDVFSSHEYDIGSTKVVEHKILLNSNKPVKLRPYKIPHALQETVKDKINKMEQHGIISQSSSPYCSPVVLVKKKDGSVRMCVDYRKLNDLTIKDAYPLPHIDQMLSELGQCTIFSTLDMQAGYHQIEIHPDDRHKTAFSSGKDLFEYNRLPFGMSNSASLFQRTMNYILHGLKNTVCYIDDVLIY